MQRSARRPSSRRRFPAQCGESSWSCRRMGVRCAPYGTQQRQRQQKEARHAPSKKRAPRAHQEQGRRTGEVTARRPREDRRSQAQWENCARSVRPAGRRCGARGRKGPFPSQRGAARWPGLFAHLRHPLPPPAARPLAMTGGSAGFELSHPRATFSRAANRACGMTCGAPLPQPPRFSKTQTGTHKLWPRQSWIPRRCGASRKS